MVPAIIALALAATVLAAQSYPATAVIAGPPAPTPTATATPTATPTVTKPLGDVNGDGAVNSIDAILILQFNAGLITSLPNPTSADVNGDGAVNSIDAELILQFTAGLLFSLPPTGSKPTPAATPTGTPPPPPQVRIGSGVGSGQVSVDLEALNIPAPGLGAWKIDVVYDPAIVTAKACTGQLGSVCNTAFAGNTVRVAGANSNSGVVGNTVLASITFSCKSLGASALTLNVQVLRDTTIGFPQPINAATVNGSVTCATPTHTPTPTLGVVEEPTATPAALGGIGAFPDLAGEGGVPLAPLLAGAAAGALLVAGLAWRLRARAGGSSTDS